ncbi:MAG: hypothetical protein JWM33_2381 [Caulobacteraceae bacterium]|nr:hypothetical protein [Caulobacteraceae bacterium]
MARTIEAFAVYHRQKELLAEYVQLTSAAIGLLQRNVAVLDAPAMLGAMVDACAISHWGRGKRYSDPGIKIAAAATFLANQTVVQHAGAFDYFSRCLVVDALRFSSALREGGALVRHDHSLLKLSPQKRWVSGHCCNDKSDQLGTLSERLSDLKNLLGWQPSAKLLPILPLFDLIRRMRNRLAHDDGLVGSELEEFIESKEISDAFRAFRTNYMRGKGPALPSMRKSSRIDLEPIHGILFGAILYEIAKELNTHVVNNMSDGEFIEMAFFYALIPDEHPFRKRHHRFAENRIGLFLAERYLRERRAPNPEEVIGHLSSVDGGMVDGENVTLWRIARDRHTELRQLER